MPTITEALIIAAIQTLIVVAVIYGIVEGMHSLMNSGHVLSNIVQANQ
jgi:predicted Co/Zn/Cd cation transporter (cation efflux family)